jgi:ribosomal protein L29
MLKKSDKAVYQAKSVKDLLADLKKAQQNLVKTKIKVGLAQEKNHTQLKKLKYEISLLKTILSQKAKENDQNQTSKK